MKDRFSKQSLQYAAFRPVYPKALYAYLLGHTVGREVAWDCGCGNGQVARDLAPHFLRVHATDISEKQIEYAFNIENVSYRVAPAHQSGLPDHSVDLIAVGQALHWFNLPAFYREARRVGKPHAPLAVWGYGLPSATPSFDKLMSHFYRDVVGPYWDAERRAVDEAYANLDFPFARAESVFFSMEFWWSLAEMEGYLSTWSSVQKFVAVRGFSPVADFMSEAKRAGWVKAEKVTFPIFLKVGRLI
jgi:SAM-dependent methyltransferase